MKDMNSKMTANSQLSTNEPKRKDKQQKLSKQLEQEQNLRSGHDMERFLWGKEIMGWEGTVNKKHNW